MAKPEKAPEIPLDKPRPPRIEDPPLEPHSGGPYALGRRLDHPLTEDKTVNTGQQKERRGFASMSPEKQREIASKGGRAAHEKGTAHEWSTDEARSAGRKGGQVSRGGRGRLVPSAPPDQMMPEPDGSNQ
jgi:general stress protein YciG